MWGRCVNCGRFSFSLNEARDCYKCEERRIKMEREAAAFSRRKSDDYWRIEPTRDEWITTPTVVIASTLLDNEQHHHTRLELEPESPFQGGESGGGGASADFVSSDSDSSSDSSSSSDSCSSCGCDCGGGGGGSD